MKRHILLATRNDDKRRELSNMLGDEVVLHHPDEYSSEEVEETADSLYGNAMLKAEAGFLLSHLPTIADDTGLEVDALDGAPGVYSSRFAGPDATYEDNVRKLLEELRGVESVKRTARFRTVLVYLDGNGGKRFDGTLEGRIIEERRGANGFGYDPVFLPEGSDLTLAELDTAAKNKISHRGMAFRSFAEWWRMQ